MLANLEISISLKMFQSDVFVIAKRISIVFQYRTFPLRFPVKMFRLED